MRSRDAVGHKIVRVLQDRVYPPAHPSVVAVRGFVLDNGTVLSLSVCEGEGEYYVACTAMKAQREVP